MDAALEQYLDELWASGREHDAELADRTQRLRNVEPDGGQVLADSPDGAFDFVFLDAERPLYTSWWPDLLRTLARPGLLVVDNVLSHAGEVEAFRALVDAEPAVASALVPIGAGTLLVTASA